MASRLDLSNARIRARKPNRVRWRRRPIHAARLVRDAEHSNVAPHLELDHDARRWSTKGYWEISVTISGNNMRLSVAGTPSAPDSVRVALQLKRALQSSTDQSAPAHAACEIELVVDGAAATAGERQFAATLTHEEVTGALPTVLLERAAASSNAKLKLCETEIALSEATRKRLIVFAEQLRAEAGDGAARDGKQLEL